MIGTVTSLQSVRDVKTSDIKIFIDGEMIGTAASLIAEARARNIETIINVLRAHEYDLSDGYAFYGGDAGLHKVAAAIADALPLGMV